MQSRVRCLVPPPQVTSQSDQSCQLSQTNKSQKRNDIRLFSVITLLRSYTIMDYSLESKKKEVLIAKQKVKKQSQGTNTK